MSSPSVSFRISRSAEDLAETIHALSQRLVKLEQRLTAMELESTQRQTAEPEEIASLENVERLLRDCRDLLEGEEPPANLKEDSNGSEAMALGERGDRYAEAA
jgi:hypothetical protein